jgi:hypothetical protein
MSRRAWTLVIALIIISGVVIIGLTALLTPQQTSPAAANALAFVQAVSRGDDDAALPLLGPQAAAWMAQNCPQGSPSACVEALIPAEWGAYVSTVFRRAAPEGDHWNVDLISTYERDLGGSGVCIFARMQQDADDAWRVAQVAGFINCGEPASRSMSSNPDTPNRMPPAAP